MKRNLFGLTVSITLAFAALLLNSCAMVAITLDPKYQGMISPPTGSERVIDQVVLEGKDDKEYSENAPSDGPMGRPYEVFEDKKNGPERHKHEVPLEQLLDGAKKLYSGETVNIRNARNNYECRVSRSERVVATASSNGTQTYRTKYYYLCRVYHVADVVVTEPIPAPITHSVELSLADVSRADLYRKIDNWLDDKKYKEKSDDAVGIGIERADFDVGRIRGDYVFLVTTLAHGPYRITSSFTIDVHDEKATISFTNTRLKRRGNSDEEAIFLQSIANAAQAEIVGFCDNLKNAVTR